LVGEVSQRSIVHNRLLKTLLTLVYASVLTTDVSGRGPSGGPNSHESLGLKKQDVVVQILSPISTKLSKKNDTFTAAILSPESLRQGQIEGVITESKPAHRNSLAELAFSFSKLTIRDKTYRIKADLEEVTNSNGAKGVDEEGHIVGSTSKKKKAGAAVAGGVLGGVIGGLAGGGTGAAVGMAAGAAAGWLVVTHVTTSGSNVVFAKDTKLRLVVSDR
jgi:hypothetical protein